MCRCLLFSEVQLGCNIANYSCDNDNCEFGSHKLQRRQITAGTVTVVARLHFFFVQLENFVVYLTFK